MNDLMRRQYALDKTMAKYRDQPFSWKGKATCIHFVRYHLRAMGHAPPVIPSFQSAIGAKRALVKSGFEDMTALFNSLLPAIPFSRALPGDIGLLAGDEGLEAVVVSLGHTWAGYHEDDLSGIKPQRVMAPLLGAWRA